MRWNLTMKSTTVFCCHVLVFLLLSCSCFSHRPSVPPPAPEDDCEVSQWSGWTPCLPYCDEGTHSRSRTILVHPTLFGQQCPHLSEDEDCGDPNGDCDHQCDHNTGNCLCDPGYELLGRHYCHDIDECQVNNGNCPQRCRNTDGGHRCKCFHDHHQLRNGSCVPDNCQMPPLPHCPGNTYSDAFGRVCKEVNPHCPHGTFTDEQCQLLCASGYSLAKILPGSNSGLFGERFLDAQFTGLINSVTCNEMTYSNIIPGWSHASELKNYYCRRSNDPPRSITLSHNTVVEHSPIDTLIGALSSSDFPSGQTITYEVITYTGGSQFGIVNGALVTKWVPTWSPPGSRGTNVHHAVVRAKDNGIPPMWSDHTFLITIINVNDAPTAIELSRGSVQSSAAVNSIVGDLSAVDSDGPLGNQRSTSFNWQMTSNDGGRFSLQNGFQVVVDKPLNDVAGMTRQITVRCNDNDASNPKYTDTVIDISILGSSVPNANFTVALMDLPEDASIGHTAAMFMLVSMTGSGTVSFDISDSPASTKATFGGISLALLSCGSDSISNERSCSAHVKTLKSLDFESKSSYPVTVVAKLAGAVVASRSISLTVIDVNEPPTDITLSSSNIKENSFAGSVVGQIQVADQDTWQTHNCSVVQGTTVVPFVVDGQNLVVAPNSQLDFETKQNYQVEISCSDNGSPPLTLSATKQVTIEDINEPPYGLELTNRFINENSPFFTVVGIIRATDPEHGTGGITFTIDGTSDLFMIGGPSNSELLVKGSLDHEAKSFSNIIIKATDRDGMSAEKTFTIEISDVNEAPTDVYLSNTKVPENLPPNVLVSPIIVVDPDSNLDASCSLANPSPYFTVQRVNLLAGNTAIDYESLPVPKQIDLDLVCHDRAGLPMSKRVTLNVTDVNEEPTSINLQSSAFSEDAINIDVGTLTVNDSDVNQGHRCNLAGNQTASRFVSIRGNTVHVEKEVNFEEYHRLPLTIYCADQPGPGVNSLGITRDFSIAVIDVNESPQTPCPNEIFVSEDASNNTMVHIFVSYDPDNEEYETSKRLGLPPASWYLKQQLTYTLTSGTTPGLPFRLLDDGILITHKALNGTAQNSYEMEIHVADDGKLLTLPDNKPVLVDSFPLSASFKCKVNIVASTDKRLSTGVRLSSTSVRENSPAQTFIGQLTTTISQLDETFTFAMIDNAADAPFMIINDNLLVSGKRDLDFEKIPRIGVGISATGSKGTTLRKYFDIAIVDVNEDATRLCLVPSFVQEYSPVATQIGQFVIEDPDYPLSIGACARQLTNTGSAQAYSCSFNTNNVAALASLGSMFTIKNEKFLHTNRTFVKADASSYVLPIICKDLSNPSKFIEEVVAVQITDSGCPTGQRPEAGSCVCANKLLGPRCDRDPSLCTNVVCQSDEVCLTLIHSQKRCVSTEYQIPILLRIPYAKTSADGYMYSFESYVEDILRGVKTSQKVTDIKGRSRRSLSAVYVEGMKPRTVKDIYSYLVLVAMDPDQQYTTLLADSICKLFAGSDIGCVNEADCIILKEAGIPCPYVYKAGTTGQQGNTSDGGSDSQPAWLYIVVCLCLVVLLLIAVIVMLYRRRRTNKNEVVVTYERDENSATVGHPPRDAAQPDPASFLPHHLSASNQMYMDLGKKGDIDIPSYDDSCRNENDYASIPPMPLHEPPPAYDEMPPQWHGATATVVSSLPEEFPEKDYDQSRAANLYEDIDSVRSKKSGLK